MTVPCKRTWALGKDRIGRPVLLQEENGSFLMRRLSTDMRDPEVQIDLTPEITAALIEVLGRK